MDDATRDTLLRLVRERGIAALGTRHGDDGWPLVSMVLYAAEPDLSALYIHVSRLAQHTQGLLADPRLGLLIGEADRPSRNPLTLPRVSILGRAGAIGPDSPRFGPARDLYLGAHPTAAMNFELADFLLYAIRPVSARFVAGFGRIADLDAGAWADLAR